MTTASKRQSRAIPGAVSAREVYRLAELCRRLGWGRHSWRKAHRDGLPVLTYGRNRYVRGADAIKFLEEHATAAEGRGL